MCGLYRELLYIVNTFSEI